MGGRPLRSRYGSVVVPWAKTVVRLPLGFWEQVPLGSILAKDTSCRKYVPPPDAPA